MAMYRLLCLVNSAQLPYYGRSVNTVICCHGKRGEKEFGDQEMAAMRVKYYISMTCRCLDKYNGNLS